MARYLEEPALFASLRLGPEEFIDPLGCRLVNQSLKAFRIPPVPQPKHTRAELNARIHVVFRRESDNRLKAGRTGVPPVKVLDVNLYILRQNIPVVPNSLSVIFFL